MDTPRCLTLLLALALATLTACPGPREPGIKEDEFGAYFFWRVTGIPKVDATDACDNETAPEPPDFGDNAFLVYKVSNDGKTAKAQECESVEAATCKDNELDLTFKVKDTKLTGSTTEAIEALSDTCDHIADLTWTVTDEGEEGSLVVAGVSALDGEDCTAFEAAVNGECVVTLDIALTLEAVDRP